MVSANDALALLQQIVHTDIAITDQDLMTNGKLNSIDIMNLVGAIEAQYNCLIDAELIDVDCFESCEAIAKFIDKVLA